MAILSRDTSREAQSRSNCCAVPPLRRRWRCCGLHRSAALVLTRQGLRKRHPAATDPELDRLRGEMLVRPGRGAPVYGAPGTARGTGDNGEPRFTRDTDLGAELQSRHAGPLVQALAGAFYADDEAIAITGEAASTQSTRHRLQGGRLRLETPLLRPLQLRPPGARPGGRVPSLDLQRRGHRAGQARLVPVGWRVLRPGMAGHPGDLDRTRGPARPGVSLPLGRCSGRSGPPRPCLGGGPGGRVSQGLQARDFCSFRCSIAF